MSFLLSPAAEAKALRQARGNAIVVNRALFYIDLQQSIPFFQGLQMADCAHAKPRRCRAWLLPLWWQPWLCLFLFFFEWIFWQRFNQTLAKP